tara:strand:+ start:4840 stop:6825 length:1986 start_codon:yes stop_codon:yes gene_type:complete
MADITNVFGGEFSPKSAYVEPPEVQLADAMRSAGIDPPAKIVIDGNLHRFSTKGRSRDDSGWYVAFPDEPVAGRFGCWRDQMDVVFRADVGRELSAVEQMAIVRRQAEAKARRDEERQRKAEVAADTVTDIWSGAIAASADHPYLQKKGIQSHGARATGDGRLIVPLFDADGNLSSLQYIGTEKRYHPGAITRGCSWTLGDLDGGTIFVAEGFATAATIHEVSNRPVVIAYSANNLPEVVRQLRERHGAQQDIVVVADNDESGVGRNKADEASAKYGARIVMPLELGDANDYAQAGHDLHGLLFPAADDWLVPADDFSEQPAPIKWLVKHWIQSDALIMVHGPSGGGKTFMVLDQVLSIASKGSVPDWFGNKVRHGPVVYLAGEGHHGLRGRVAAWKQHHGVGGLEMWLSRHGVDLNTPSGYQKTAEAIRALGVVPGVVVVDTLHRHLFGDENSSENAKTMLDACGALIQEFKCSVILVHHTGVNMETQHRARGSSAWRGALDIEISVVPGETIEIVQRKSKDAEIAPSLFTTLKKIEIAGWFDEDGEQVTSAVLVAGEEPVKPVKESPIAKHRKMFERCWWAAGAEVLDGAPYLTRAGAKRKLDEDGGRSDRTIQNDLSAVYENKFIGALILADMIQAQDDGWIVIDKVVAGALMVQKNG